MSRFLIKENIVQEADEDLERLLLSPEKKAKLFNYSPFILRIVNEILLEKGFTIGLGNKTKRDIIDKQWSAITLPILRDFLLRVIDRTETEGLWDFYIIIRNNKISNKIWSFLYQIKRIKPKNNLVFRGSFSSFEEILLEKIIDDVKKTIEKHSFTYTIERFRVLRKEVDFENKKIELFYPSLISIVCKRCTMCELPSHYSVNPIPNHSKQHFLNLFTNKRICYPSNLACLSLTEAVNIAAVTSLRMENFCEPAMYSKNKDGIIVDYQLTLKQKNGTCIFFEKETGLCKVHGCKPLNCLSYPFLIQKLVENHFIIELDYSCPGIEVKQNNNSLNLYLEQLFEKLQTNVFSPVEFNNIYAVKWDLSQYYPDEERVLQEEVDEALDYLKEKYKEYIAT